VYIACVSNAHQVAASGHYVVIVSTIIETPTPEREIEFALSLLGPIREKFVWTTDMMQPIDDGIESRLFIARSYDATSHFETVCDDVKDVYKRYAGVPLEVKKRPSAEEEQETLNKSLGAVNDV
jgi:Rab GDP dissociation inhibitor